MEEKNTRKMIDIALLIAKEEWLLINFTEFLILSTVSWKTSLSFLSNTNAFISENFFQNVK